MVFEKDIAKVAGRAKDSFKVESIESELESIWFYSVW